MLFEAFKLVCLRCVSTLEGPKHSTVENCAEFLSFSLP